MHNKFITITDACAACLVQSSVRIKVQMTGSLIQTKAVTVCVDGVDKTSITGVQSHQGVCC